MVIIAEQMQSAVDDQPEQFLAQADAILRGVIFCDRHTNGNGGDAPTIRGGAEIERDDVSCRVILQKIALQKTNFSFLDKVDFELDGCRCAFPPKMI